MPVTTNPIIEYHFIRPPAGDQRVQIQFTGPFQGKTVLWQAEIATLQYWRGKRSGDQASAPHLRQFIEIQPGDAPDQYRLFVGLACARIDHPTILKTIIMIRNYKRLGVGCHEYGEKQA